MNVSPLGISSTRLPVLPARAIAAPETSAPDRNTMTVNAVSSERVYVGEYVAAGQGPSFFFRDDTFPARRDAEFLDAESKTGSRRTMVQAYLQAAGASIVDTRPSGLVDYYA